MFDNHAPDLKANNIKPEAGPQVSISGIKTAVMIVLLVIFTGGAVFWFLSRASRPPAAGPDRNEPLASGNQLTATSAPGSTLPFDQEAVGVSGGIGSSTADGVKAESLSFADFYKKEDRDFTPRPAPLKLPLNAKTEAANYYDLSRKIDFTAQLGELNKEGITIIDNPFAGQADDFYSLYGLLAEKEIPELLTADFIVYYYQNRLKEAFKEVEANVFFADLWRINKSFFDLANNRYRKRRDKVGLVNDPILEGERLEAAFFAVGLELLKPQAEQIASGQHAAENKFSEKESLDFNFELPSYLETDVEREVKLIRGSRGEERSPVFLYRKNYADYFVPAAYKKSAKLANFYLAIRWFNSVFPLYPTSAACRDCLLDQNDWLVNQIAAAFITKDFFDNQDLKNQWARIYKIISFFRGLRRDLTYLHYQDVMLERYGENYRVEQIFSDNSPEELVADRDRAIAAAEVIAGSIEMKFKFPAAEGGFDRADASLKPVVGMRLLQESFWPDDYLLGRLTVPQVGVYTGKAGKSAPVSACTIGMDKNYYRCAGIGRDIISLIYPLGSSDSYFKANTEYRDYSKRAGELGAELGKFNVTTWHSNVYWLTLDVANRAILNEPSLPGPINQQSGGWRKKDVNLALSAWVNLELPSDEFVSDRQTGVNLGQGEKASVYVEPNLDLLDELIANGKMLTQMFAALRVTKEADYTAKKLSDLIDELDRLRAIVKKELNRETLDADDQEAVGNFLSQYVVDQAGEKVFYLKFKNKNLKESIAGLRLALAAYQLSDKKMILAGPVFNYQEGGR